MARLTKLRRPVGRPAKNAPEYPGRELLQRRVRELEDENVQLRKAHDRLAERYKKLVDKTIELVFGDLKDDKH